jgi:hypothetical protein
MRETKDVDPIRADEPMVPEEARVPDMTTRLYPGRLFFEWMEKYDTQYLHIFKPVEADIRAQEGIIRDRCQALYPLSEDPNIRFVQLEMQALQDRCDARRITWRDAGGCAAWPEAMGSLLSSVLHLHGLTVLKPRIEFVPELDAWDVEFRGMSLPEKRIHKLIEGIVEAFENLGVTWPKEIFE